MASSSITGTKGLFSLTTSFFGGLLNGVFSIGRTLNETDAAVVDLLDTFGEASLMTLVALLEHGFGEWALGVSTMIISTSGRTLWSFLCSLDTFSVFDEDSIRDYKNLGFIKISSKLLHKMVLNLD